MKKNLIVCALLLVSAALMAQKPVITFKETDHNFGKIHEEDGRVSYIFEFKNEGMEPLVLSNVRASCGCTTPKWTREPIEAGQTGNITVTYNPNGRPGNFQKTITITSNAEPATTKITIRGEVIPKQAKPTIRYNVKMGDLSLKSSSIEFGTIYKDASKNATLDYTNLTDHDITVGIAGADSYDFLTTQLSLTTLKPNEVGTLNINYAASLCPVWGEQTYDLYFIVNGEKKLTDEFKITLKADVAEDFTRLSAEDLQVAPIAVVNDGMGSQVKVNLGTVKAGSKLTHKLHIKNAGVQPLQIRRIQTTTDIKAAAGKTSVKSGKTADIKLEINNANNAAGTYTRPVTIITNDPKNPRIFVSVTWTVE